eukprot:sb/3471639/
MQPLLLTSIRGRSSSSSSPYAGRGGGVLVRQYNKHPVVHMAQPIRTRYLGHVTGYQPIRGQYFLIRSVPVPRSCLKPVKLQIRRQWCDRGCNNASKYNMVPEAMSAAWIEDSQLYVGPRFTGRMKYPKNRKLTVFDPDIIPGTPIYRIKPFPPSIPVNRSPTVLLRRVKISFTNLDIPFE